MESRNALRPSGAAFQSTRWSSIAVAADSSDPEARQSLERLCQAYWPPLFAYALRQGRDIPSAQDLTQSFFAHFIERGYLRAADRARGRFRTFLLTCFQHFLIHEWEKTQALRRGGRFSLVSLEEHVHELETRAAEGAVASPEQLYDREWAMALLARALTRLSGEFAASGNERKYRVLSRFLDAEPGPGDYARAAEELGIHVRAVKLGVHRMRRRFGRLVRDEIRETVSTDADAQEEMQHLIKTMTL